MSIGADTALNSIVEVMDKIKQSAEECMIKMGMTLELELGVTGGEDVNKRWALYSRLAGVAETK